MSCVEVTSGIEVLKQQIDCQVENCGINPVGIYFWNDQEASI